jgi:HPr kinase/phosphorylase
MNNPITAHSLFEFHKNRLGLTWIAGEQGKKRLIRKPNEHPIVSMLIGHMNCIRPNRIQVIGASETSFLKSLSKNSSGDFIGKLFESEPAAILVSSGLTIPEDIQQLADETDTPLWSATASDLEVINHILYYLNRILSESAVIHGVFMEVVGIGVLLTGESGIGKSELALELLSRGHRLIADDAPEFSRIAPDTINGSCPPAIRGFLEVRGLGILNIRAMFGDSAIKQNKNLRLIVNLKQLSEIHFTDINRLEGHQESQYILDIKIPKVMVPVAPGRNLAVIVESAARNQILLDKGYNATEAFIKQQREIMERSEK